MSLIRRGRASSRRPATQLCTCHRLSCLVCFALGGSMHPLLGIDLARLRPRSCGTPSHLFPLTFRWAEDLAFHPTRVMPLLVSWTRLRLSGSDALPKSRAGTPRARPNLMPRPPAKSQSPSCTVDAEGKEICKRFVLGRCKLTNCRFSHTCPIPLPSGKACGQKHTANKHTKTPH